MPFATSNAVAYRAAKAAFIFKEGKNRADYEKALPHLVKFFQVVRDGSDTTFDVEKAAKLELEWWIVHRQFHIAHCLAGRPLSKPVSCETVGNVKLAMGNEIQKPT